MENLKQQIKDQLTNARIKGDTLAVIELNIKLIELKRKEIKNVYLCK